MFFFKRNINSYIKTGKFWVCLKKKENTESVNNIICKLKNKNFKFIQNTNTLYFSINNVNYILFWKLFNINLFSQNVSWYYRFKLIGVGYKINYNKMTNTLEVSYGYSNIHKILLPKSINFYELAERQLYGISSVNKMNLLNFLNKLEKIRRFDPYKGKGLIFENKFYLRKINKKNDK